MQQWTVENCVSWVKQLAFEICHRKCSLPKVFTAAFQISGQRPSEALSRAPETTVLLLFLLFSLRFGPFFLRWCLFGVGILERQAGVRNV